MQLIRLKDDHDDDDDNDYDEVMKIKDDARFHGAERTDQIKKKKERNAIKTDSTESRKKTKFMIKHEPEQKCRSDCPYNTPA